MEKSAQEAGKAEQMASAGSAPVSRAGDPGDPFGIGQWLRDMPGGVVHPLMANPTAAMAAATAIGFGFTGHFAGLMLGAMQGLADTTQTAATPAEKRKADETGEPASAVGTDIEKAGTRAVKTAATRRMAPKNVRAARIVVVQPDDLKRIAGIGPKLEQVLNGMGIRHFSDIAGWTAKDVQRIDDQLGFAGRIARDGWVEQAKALMKG